MIKKFFGNLLLLMLANLLVKPIWVLGIERTVQNTVGTETYGNYAVLLNSSFLLTILLDLGINNYNSKMVAQHPHMIDKKFSAILVIKMLLAMVYIVATLLFGLLSGCSQHEMYLLLWLCLNQVLAYYIVYLRTNISALQFFKTDSFLSVLDKLLMIGLCGLVLFTSYRSSFTLEYFIFAQTVSYLLTAAVCFALVSRQLQKIRLSWNMPLLLVIIRKSYPYAFLAFLMVAYTRVDSLMLKWLLPGEEGYYQAGVYAAAYRLLDASNMLGVLVASLLLPIFLRMIRQKQPLEKLVHFSFPLVLIPAMLLAAFSFVFRNELMQLMYVKTDPHSGTIFAILMFSFLPMCTIYVFGTLLTANENLAFLNKVALASLLLNIVLNWVLIPRFHALGAAISGITTQSLVALMHYTRSYRLVKLKADYLLALKLLATGVLMLAAGWGMKEQGASMQAATVVFVLVAGSLTLLFRIFDWKEGMQILKNYLKR